MPEAVQQLLPGAVPGGPTECRRCGRGLKRPESILAGIGPVCQRKEDADIDRLAAQLEQMASAAGWTFVPDAERPGSSRPSANL